MRIGLRIACVVLACLPGLRAADPPLAEDPWTGKGRDDLLTLLGEPTKKKADGKKVEYSGDDTPSVQGKLTLKFHLTGGRVERWSVSPKKALQGR